MVKHMILTVEGKGKLEFRLRPKHKEAVLIDVREYKGSVLDIPGTLDYGDEEYTVTELGHRLFNSSFLSFDEVIIPDSIKNLPAYLFSCAKIRKIVIGGDIKTIPEYCFRECHVEEVVLRDGVEVIEEGAFCGVYDLKHITLPKSLKSIHTYAFHYSGLREITIPESVERICSSAFTGCKDLKDVYFNHTIKPPQFYHTSGNFFPYSRLNPIKLHVSNNIFSKYKNIKSLQKYNIIPSINSFAVRLDSGKCYITCKIDDAGKNSYSGDLVLPEKYFGEDGREYDIIGIDDFAFTGCKDLKSVSLVNNKDIKYSDLAFFDCETKIITPKEDRDSYNCISK